MKKFEIILASESLRRIDILKSKGFDIIPYKHYFNEESMKEIDPVKFVEKCSFEKANSIKQKHKGKMIIGADTIVVFNHLIIGKPKNKKHAYQILKQLSGKIHFVYTGITLIYNEKVLTSNTKTDVKFKKLCDEEIEQYLKQATFLDKAGAYAIQKEAAFFIDYINGDYFNIVGFPLRLFIDMFYKITGVKYYEYIY